MFYGGRRSPKSLAGHEGGCGGRLLLKKKRRILVISSRDLFWEWWVHVTLFKGAKVTSKKGMKRALWILNHLADVVFDVRVFFSLRNFTNGVCFFVERFDLGNVWVGKKGGGDNDFSTFDACIFIVSNGWLSHQKLDGRIVQETCWRSEETCITPVGLEYDSMLTPLPWCPYNKKTNRYRSGEQNNWVWFRCVACDFFEGGNHTTGDEFYIVLVNKQAWKLNMWKLVCWNEVLLGFWFVCQGCLVFNRMLWKSLVSIVWTFEQEVTSHGRVESGKAIGIF